MKLYCNICDEPLGQPAYVSPNNLSVDSIGRQFQGTTTLFFCDRCGHLQTRGLENVEKYYREDYNFLIEVEEEDQLYKIVDGKLLYRQDHQLATLLNKIQIPDRARVLDYGCGKGAFLKKLLMARPDIVPHFLEVSEVYVPFWRDATGPDNWAIFSPRPEWTNYFDLVVSFFTLEHVTNPKQVVSEIAGLLKPGGLFYFVVPNPYGQYIADFLVIDHVNHYSESSLRYLLSNSGLRIAEIDSQAHDVAFVAAARKTDDPFGEYLSQEVGSIPALKRQVEEICHFWYQAPDRIRSFEEEHAECSKAAIYGAGVCGSFIASHLKDLSKVECFIDLNPYKQRHKVLGKSVIPPIDLDVRTCVIYVGLNPVVARKAIESITAWSEHQHDYFYL